MKPAIPPELFREIVNSGPFVRHVGMSLLDFSDGQAVIGLEVFPFHLNTQGIVHGGMLCSLVDMAAAVSVGTRLVPDYRPRTVKMEIQYLAPGLPGRSIQAHGRVMSWEGQHVVAEAVIRDDKGTTLCRGTCMYTIVGI